MQVSHWDRITQIFGVREDEQFIPELSWQSDALARVMAESETRIRYETGELEEDLEPKPHASPRRMVSGFPLVKKRMRLETGLLEV